MKIKGETLSLEEITDIEKSRVKEYGRCAVCDNLDVVYCTSKWRVCPLCIRNKLKAVKAEYLAKRIITRAKYPINKIIKYQKKGE